MEINPYKKARQELGLTQKALSQEIQVTPQVILRVEQGLFSAPPNELTNYLSEHYYFKLQPGQLVSYQVNNQIYRLSPADLTRAYYNWVYAQRNENKDSRPARYARQYFISMNWEPHYSPRIAWKEFRTNILGLSVAATAKLLVLQISLVQDLEKTGRNANQIRDILLEWGIPTEAINYIPANMVKRNNLAELQ